jgi:hypothetical protein
MDLLSFGSGVLVGAFAVLLWVVFVMDRHRGRRR